MQISLTGQKTGTEEQSDLSALQEENPAKEEITAQEESQAAEVSEFKGKGTAEDPYQIGTAEELKLVATKVNAGEIPGMRLHIISRPQILICRDPGQTSGRRSDRKESLLPGLMTEPDIRFRISIR